MFTTLLQLLNEIGEIGAYFQEAAGLNVRSERRRGLFKNHAIGHAMTTGSRNELRIRPRGPIGRYKHKHHSLEQHTIVKLTAYVGVPSFRRCGETSAQTGHLLPLPTRFLDRSMHKVLLKTW
jgi:hypothetical protein